jgi:hypothetical protein
VNWRSNGLGFLGIHIPAAGTRFPMKNRESSNNSSIGAKADSLGFLESFRLFVISMSKSMTI